MTDRAKHVQMQGMRSPCFPIIEMCHLCWLKIIIFMALK